jgi:hypothetical protein
MRARNPQLLHVSQAEDGEAPAFRRHPEGDGRVSPASAGLPEAGREGAARQPGLAHPSAASRPRPTWWCRSRCCSTSPASPRRGTSRCSGASSAATRPRRARRRIPGLDAAAGYAVRYFNDFVRPARRFRAPDARERRRSPTCATGWPPGPGRRIPRRCRARSMRWARTTASSRCATGSAASTRCCWAPSRGRAFGGFVALYGVEETASMIDGRWGADARERLRSGTRSSRNDQIIWPHSPCRVLACRGTVKDRAPVPARCNSDG